MLTRPPQYLLNQVDAQINQGVTYTTPPRGSTAVLPIILHAGTCRPSFLYIYTPAQTSENRLTCALGIITKLTTNLVRSFVWRARLCSSCRLGTLCIIDRCKASARDTAGAQHCKRSERLLNNNTNSLNKSTFVRLRWGCPSSKQTLPSTTAKVWLPIVARASLVLHEVGKREVIHNTDHIPPPMNP